MYIQRSKLTFSKSHLLATFNCKMVAIKKILVGKKKGKKKHLYPGVDTSCMLNVCLLHQATHLQHFCKLLRLLTYQLKDCNNRQDKAKEDVW